MTGARGTPRAADPLPKDLHTVLVDATRRWNAAIARALHDGDLKIARSEIHSMRSAFTMIGKREISTLCASLEALALAGDAAAFTRESERYRGDAREIIERRAAGDAKPSHDTLSDTSPMNR
ncbi:hypothetical protein WT72_22035 [Burkholderia pseudomultivorans]|uniref:HPt domain-containing protein n=1 Tax=Burkholderia pseudomultivorans TaxID=1207504 RepID=A0A132F2S1_9BURK|nr:hypothetical protein WT57_15930 [Burkholderia pseudomultivorans]KWI52158.1 hypothetical protein WT72_22035 [Burkholderia pseudomultivorans]